jgi:polysaccharide biosynthesis protein PslA
MADLSDPIASDDDHTVVAKAAAPRRRRMRFTSNLLTTLGISSDVLCFIVAFFAAMVIYASIFDRGIDQPLHMNAAVILAINYFLIRISRDGYTTFRGQGSDVGQGGVYDFIIALVLTGLTATQLRSTSEMSTGMTGIYVATCATLLMLSRIPFRRLAWWLMERGIIGQRVVIYGADRTVVGRVVDLLELERLPHLKIVGFADDRGERADRAAHRDVSFIGGFSEILAMARDGDLDQVIIALPQVGQDRLDRIIEQLSAVSIDVCVLSREILELRSSFRLGVIGSLPVMTLLRRPVRDFDLIGKNLQDYVLAAVGLIVLSPILLLTAIAIRIESPGPILFRQLRFGFNNSEIEVLKFRSMYVDTQDESGAARTVKNDARVTRVGAFIRRFSIDELPQLVNVLQGNMSVVGPRPHATKMRVEDAFYFDAVKGYAARHRVKPGITGLAQVRGLRGEIADLDRARRRVEYDIYYIEHWSPFLDIRIIIETVFRLVWDKNAY